MPTYHDYLNRLRSAAADGVLIEADGVLVGLANPPAGGSDLDSWLSFLNSSIPDVAEINRRIQTLVNLTTDLHGPPQSTGWGTPTDDTQGGIYLKSSTISLSDLQGLGDSDWEVSYSSGVGGKWYALRVPADTNIASVRVKLTVTGQPAYYEHLNIFSKLGQSSDSSWDLYYAGTDKLGSTITDIEIQTTATTTHSGDSDFVGNLSKSKVLTTIGLTDALVDRLKASLSKFNAATTYALEAMVVDSEIIWVSKVANNVGNSPTGDDGSNWVTLIAYIKSHAAGITQNAGDARYVQKSGDTMTGALTLSGEPTNDLHATTKKYVDGKAGGSGSGAYKHYDSLPDPDSYEINDLIEFGGHSLILQETYATADTFAAETGTADVHTGREVVDKYIGMANSDSRDVYAPTGLWTSNPGNEIAYIMEHDGTVEMGVLRSAYRTAKGSNEAANDVLKLRMTINSTTETLGLTYTPNLDYESESFGYRTGYDYLVFRGTVSGGGNFVLQSEGEGEEATFIILNSGETSNFFTHAANSKHWVLYHELDAVYNELLGREANQKVDDAILGLNAVQSRVRALDFDFNEAPKATVTIDQDTVIDGRKDPSWFMEITDVEAQNDILVIDFENFDSIEYSWEHLLPGSTDAAGRMYIHLSDELLHQNTAYDFLGRSVDPLRVNNGDGTFTNLATSHGAGIEIHRISTGFRVQILPTHPEFDSSTNVNNLQPPVNFLMTIKLYGQESLAALDGSSLRTKIDEVEEDVTVLQDRLVALTKTEYTNLVAKDSKKFYFTHS